MAPVLVQASRPLAACCVQSRTRIPRAARQWQHAIVIHRQHEKQKPHLENGLRYGPYFVTESRGHWMSSYPILTSLLITPLYVVPAWWLSRQPDAVPASTISLIADTMEKLSASLIAALSAGILYLALGRIISGPGALVIALIYGMASSTWSISSQALWTHGLAQLAFALLLLVASP